MPKEINPIYIRRSFQVTTVLSVYHRENVMPAIAYDERYWFWQVTFLLNGEGTYTVDGDTYPFCAGDVLFRRPNRLSRIAYVPGVPVSYAIISFACSSEAMQSLPARPVKLYGEERATLLDLIRTGLRICEPLRASASVQGFALKPDTPEAALEFVGVSLERFLIMVNCRLAGIDLLTDESEKSNRHTGQSQTAGAIRRYLEERVCERIRIDTLAETFGLSQTALMKLYKREFGVSVGEEFTQMKLAYAKMRIAHSALNFAEIAEELGYTSAGYFSRVFRAHEGLSPTEYSRMVSKRV
ncbi:MAG: AraC family transcriptional regulator [Clostridiaceae bacterium]|nr:AraC family transcriptional regulator [Clostridiaceae bacterium]